MPEFWEKQFREKQAMWGTEPVDSAKEVAVLFKKEGVLSVLIPGFGYGRNAKPFTELDIQVTGIEISKTAIALAKKLLGDGIKIYHASVTDMPFDQLYYDGIYCHALIHLLEDHQRTKLIADCYNQLRPGRRMVFTTISTNTSSFGEGELLGSNQYRTKHGVTLFYYDQNAIVREFSSYGLSEAKEISEPARTVAGKPSQILWQISCTKKNDP